MAVDESSFANWSGKSQLERQTILHDLFVTVQAMARACMPVEGPAALLEQMNAIRESGGISVEVDPLGVIIQGP
jgi:hypothetical protein